MGTTRRDFMKTALLGTAGMALLGSESRGAALSSGSSAGSPNLLFIHVDQQHFQAVSGTGCAYLRTPNMDRLVQRGVTFSQAYAANPICSPARGCWYTGRASSEHGMLSNNHTINPNIPDLGQWMSARGYDCYYTGKWHINGRNAWASFNVFNAYSGGQGEQCDPAVSKSAQAFLRNYRGTKPFFLNVGFLQPHDCCYWVFAHEEDIGRIPYPRIEPELPPLPNNFNYNVQEAEVLRQHLASLRDWTKKWSPLHWRYYMWSYYRHVEMVDAEIGRVLDALDDSRFASNTLVIMTSDHGDGLARRQLCQKWTLYDEVARVHLTIVPPGSAGGGRIDTTHVVSGLDITPTLCDYAGIPAPPNCRGVSLRPLVEQRGSFSREFIVSESNITGRMVRTPEYKLVVYKNDPVEQLFDMRTDPWEMNNLSGNPAYADVVRELKDMLAYWESRLIIP